MTAFIGKKLEKDFYIHEEVLAISRELLGKYLVTNFDNILTVGRIVETEAYRAPDDKACHAHNNRFTNRTRIMFEDGGVAYIYLCYGIHHLFNIVTAKEGMAHAVLIRAVEPVHNVSEMLLRRGMEKVAPRLTAGPGVLTKALGISKQFTGQSLTAPDSPIWIEEKEPPLPDSDITTGPRVGIDYAEECALWPWRFKDKNSLWTSKP